MKTDEKLKQILIADAKKYGNNYKENIERLVAKHLFGHLKKP